MAAFDNPPRWRVFDSSGAVGNSEISWLLHAVVDASIRIRGVQHQTDYSIRKHGIKKAIRLARRWLAQKRREARSA